MKQTYNSSPGSYQPFTGYVVCIGASAGGLDALERFFKKCPKDTGAAFVVVQHLSPDHKSMMNNLLSRYTEMPVITVEDEMTIEQDHLYLIPPGSIMHVGNGRLHLRPKNPRGLTLPIDIFFNALAESYGRHAVGIILSGTGSDGTRGAMAINAAGGFLMAQDPESAGFDGMPRSVIGTGLVDEVMLAEDMPERLVAHIKGLPYQDRRTVVETVPYHKMSHEELFAAIMQLLYQSSGIDFNDYKPSTVMRRIERRQQVRHRPELDQYLDLLEQDRNELLTLRREMLISVTSFFRDQETFDRLASQVVRPLVAGCHAHDTLRVWVAGTATGEEAYSIGMLFLEAFDEERCWPGLKLFATDVDQQCIETAGVGLYPESAAAEITMERLERFFLRKGDSFLVKDELRRNIVFARHNLLADPPFTKMDLVVCRNTLIYFKASAQEHALRALQYALKPEGALLLGSSESLSPMIEGLEILSAKHKLFQRKNNAPMPFVGQMAAPSLKGHNGVRQRRAVQRRSQIDHSLSEAGLSELMNRYAPPAILVGDKHEALHLYGEVSDYFKVKAGSASLEINRLLPNSLTPVASALLYKSARDGSSLISDLLPFTLPDGSHRMLRLSAHPLPNRGAGRLTLLCFESQLGEAAPAPEQLNIDSETAARIEILERELEATRESLQATIEELETSNEELQATNEELMASNEELQSSNEELQSVNEEMSTVNTEYQEKMLILNRVNADMDSMARAVGVGTVFVDSRLQITRYSPDSTKIFKLRDTDVGRPLDDISHVLDYPDFIADLRQTLQTQRSQEHEIGSLDGNTVYLVRMLSYLVPSSADVGVVATFVDITAVHNQRRLQTIIDALPEHIAVVDKSGEIVMVNRAWIHFAQANGDPGLKYSGIGSNYLDVCQVPGGEDAESARQAAQGLRRVLEGDLPAFSLEYPCHSATEERWFVMNVAPVHNADLGAVVSHVNVTSWVARRRS